MAKLAWDRLLETCHKRDAPLLLLVPGGPPIIRVAETWRSLQVPPVARADLAELVSQLDAPDGRADGYAYRDFWYGNAAFFRVLMFGYPDTSTIVVSREKPPAPPGNGTGAHP